MAGEDTQQGAPAQPTGPGLPCPPCRGTGRVISHLGGTPRELACPWCEGSGRWLAAHDAQAARQAHPPSGEGA